MGAKYERIHFVRKAAFMCETTTGKTWHCEVKLFMGLMNERFKKVGFATSR
jgi:hypothetical protein